MVATRGKKEMVATRGKASHNQAMFPLFALMVVIQVFALQLWIKILISSINVTFHK